MNNSNYTRKDRAIKEDGIKYLEVHLTDHCNLNCKGCCHFSPLSQPYFLLPKEFDRSAKKLSEIIHQKLSRLIFLGGEPLLNSSVLDFLVIAKKYFPFTDVQILTNGILLPKMHGEFWQICRKLDIQIDITMYPINFDYQKVINKITNEQVRFFIYDDGIVQNKQFDKYNLDINASQNSELNFFQECLMAKDCAFFTHGRIYPCQLAYNVKILNNYFNLSFKQSNNDFIDIYNVKDEKEIYEFLTHPIPFCKYCDFSNHQKTKWEYSKKVQTEW